MANLTFNNIYLVDTSSTPAFLEANQINIFYTGAGPGTIDDGTANANFDGNDVAVSLTIGGSTVYGWITRTIKDHGDTKAFYLWTDPDFTSLAAAIASGNQDHDANVLDNSGYVLVIDQAWFDAQPMLDPDLNLKHLDSSSDPVAANLNALFPGTPLVTITEDANNDGYIRDGELVGNVDVQVTLPTDAVAGDVLTVASGASTQTINVTSGMVSTGYATTSFPPPAEGGTITVTAFLTNTFGITGGTGSDSAIRDTAGPAAPVVTITEDVNNDGVINIAELSGNVDVSIQLPLGAVAGDVLWVANGATTQSFTLTSGQISAGTARHRSLRPPRARRSPSPRMSPTAAATRVPTAATARCATRSRPPHPPSRSPRTSTTTA
jgi:hypothetical protein